MLNHQVLKELLTIIHSDEKLPNGYSIDYDRGCHCLTYCGLDFFRTYTFLAYYKEWINLSKDDTYCAFLTDIHNPHGLTLLSENLEENKFALSILGNDCTIPIEVLESSYVLNKVNKEIDPNGLNPERNHYIIVIDENFCNEFVKLMRRK